MPACSESSTFPSPGAPDYRQNSAVGCARGWSSERAPLPLHNQGRGYGGRNSLFVPFGNVRALPSKWEDAEKWILSPGCGEGMGAKDKAERPPHRRPPKSKSGPLGNQAGVGSYAVTSPRVRCGSLASSPMTTGARAADHGSCGRGDVVIGGGRRLSGGDSGDGRTCSASESEHRMVRSASMNGLSESMDTSSLPASQDENDDSPKDAFQILHPMIMKDVGTQMSPCSSDHSFSGEKPLPSPSSPPASSSAPEPRSRSVEFDVGEVQIHDRVTITRWSKKHIVRGWEKDSTSIVRWRKKTTDSRPSAWKSTDTAKCTAKLEREEARIAAWENLQKAKTEAAIRTLETKLEKKRASSMEKIRRKLRAVQTRAEEMRRRAAAVPGKASDGRDAITKKRATFSQRAGQLTSLRGCLTCHVL